MIAANAGPFTPPVANEYVENVLLELLDEHGKSRFRILNQSKDEVAEEKSVEDEESSLELPDASAAQTAEARTEPANEPVAAPSNIIVTASSEDDAGAGAGELYVRSTLV